MSLKKRYFKSDVKFFSSAAIAIMIASAGLTGCQTGTVLNGGYVVDAESLNLVPEGSSREQVLLSLGTPSTTATFDNEVFYYISQRRTRSVAFQKLKVVDQTVLAIYFDKDGVVARRANYTLQDGKVFDTIGRVTPTGGKELTFLQQMLSGGSAASAARSLFGGGAGGTPQNPSSLR
jgi:outer membrane protein assembly factor BamE (lipoprotein component of BamABCDE complex)